MRLFIGLSLCDVAGNISVQLNCDLFENQEAAMEAAVQAAMEAHPDGQIIGSGGAQVSDDTVQRAAELLRSEHEAAAERAWRERINSRPQQQTPDTDGATGMAKDLQMIRARLRAFV